MLVGGGFPTSPCDKYVLCECLLLLKVSSFVENCACVDQTSFFLIQPTVVHSSILFSFFPSVSDKPLGRGFMM